MAFRTGTVEAVMLIILGSMEFPLGIAAGILLLMPSLREPAYLWTGVVTLLVAVGLVGVLLRIRRRHAEEELDAVRSVAPEFRVAGAVRVQGAQDHAVTPAKLVVGAVVAFGLGFALGARIAVTSG